MALIDDEPVRKRRVHEIGQDLHSLSVEDLQERIAALRVEIERLEADMDAKSRTRSAADALFRKV